MARWRWLTLGICAFLVACQAIRPSFAPSAAVSMTAPAPGTYDNHAQSAPANGTVPHVHMTIASTGEADWTLWTVQLGGRSPVLAQWAMHWQPDGSGGGSMVPYRANVAKPDTAFDSGQWTALDACALHEASHPAGGELRANAALCAPLTAELGTTAALLPIAIDATADGLRLRFFGDQARGPDAAIDARRVRWYTGQVVINGGGPKATAGNNDWHIDRGLEVGSEGERVPIRWRDGAPSGWSIELARVGLHAGDAPVLRLAVVEDATDQVYAYAFASPDAPRIGLNLGWLQIGLRERDLLAAAPGSRN